MSAADATWIAAAITDGDRDAAARGVVDADGFHVRLLAIEEETYRLAYDTVSNGVLWFAHHGLWDLVPRPPSHRPCPQPRPPSPPLTPPSPVPFAHTPPDAPFALVRHAHPPPPPPNSLPRPPPPPRLPLTP